VTSRTAAVRYARALFDVAVKEGLDLQQVERDLAGFAGLLAGHAELQKVMLNPAVPAPRKRAAVEEIVKRGKPGAVVGKLLVLLAERDRMALLPDLQNAYRQRLLDHQNIIRAEVTTAAPLAADRAKAIEETLARATGRTVTLSTTVDPALIGGAVTRIGSVVYDGSLARQLEKMKERLAT
jgi:F-type H+-transporting ATPase subunit delta